jgi:hypothetical protein
MPRQRNGETFDKSSEIIKVHLQKIFTFIKTDSVLDEPSMGVGEQRYQNW